MSDARYWVLDAIANNKKRVIARSGATWQSLEPGLVRRTKIAGMECESYPKPDMKYTIGSARSGPGIASLALAMTCVTMLDAGYWMLDSGCLVLDTRCWIKEGLFNFRHFRHFSHLLRGIHGSFVD